VNKVIVIISSNPSQLLTLPRKSPTSSFPALSAGGRTQSYRKFSSINASWGNFRLFAERLRRLTRSTHSSYPITIPHPARQIADW